MKNKLGTFILAGTLVVSTATSGFAAALDFTNTVDSSKYTRLEVASSKAARLAIASNMSAYVVEGKDGNKYKLVDVQEQLGKGLTFDEAIEQGKLTPVDKPVEGELKVVEVSAINARELKVTFNKEVNKASAINEDNYQFVKNGTILIVSSDFVGTTNKKGVLSKDKKSVVFRLDDSKKLTNADRYSVHVSTNVLGTDYKPVEKHVDSERIFTDMEAPKLVETTLVNNQLVFEFDEPVNVANIVVKVDGEQVAAAGQVSVYPVGDDTPTNYEVATPAITNDELLKTGKHDVVIYNVEDLIAPNANKASSIRTSYTISEDKIAPSVQEVKAVNSRSFHVKFSEEVQALTAANFEVKKGNHTFENTEVLVAQDFKADPTGKTWRVSVAESADATGKINPLWAEGDISVSLTVTVKGYKDLANLLGAPTTRTVTLAKDTKRPELVGTAANKVDETSIVVKFDGKVAIHDNTKITVKNKDGVVLTSLGTISATDDEVTIYISSATPGYSVLEAPYKVEFGANAVKYVKDITPAAYDVNENKNNALVATANPADSVDAVVVKADTIIPTTINNDGIIEIDFSEKMDSSAINPANYSIDGVALDTKTKVEFIGGTEKVRLTLPEGMFTKTQTAKFTISNNVKTKGGSKVVANALTKEPVEKIITFTDNAQPELAKAEFYVAKNTSTETNQLKVTFNEKVKNLTADDFKITVNGNKVGINSVVSGDTTKEAIFTLDSQINVNNANVVLEAIEEGTKNTTMDTTDEANNKLKAGKVTVSGKALKPSIVTNQAPTVANPIADTTGTVAGGMVTVDASTTFVDADGDPLAITATSGDTNVATVVMNGTDVEVTPVAVGTATISVVANDGNGGTVTETFDIVVGNSAPTGINQTGNATQDVLYALDLDTVFTDVDGDALTYTVVSDDGNATAAINADGKTLEYTPTAADKGNTVIITVKANDGTVDSANVTVTLTVAP
ncbi:Ig-like domain-containing protein [Tissierella praeacuta]|uniref:Ig-like domain-containing protein n=1 Tax=Tissierella praeacuta TaxID=43131 RepID=UPI0035148B83